MVFVQKSHLHKNRLNSGAFCAKPVVAPGLLRVALWQPDNSYRLYFALETRADGLLIGCLIAVIASWQMLPTGKLSKRLIQVVGILATGYLLYIAIGFPFSSGYPTAASFLYLRGGFS